MERPGQYYPGAPEPPNSNKGKEYGCKFCTKTFPNRQALAGHQNAHKIQRATEKRALEMRDVNHHFGYYGGDGNPYGPPQPVPGFIVAGNVQTRSLNSGMVGSGSGSGLTSRPDNQDLAGFATSRIRPGGNPGRGNRDLVNIPGNDQQCEDESGLDLSLKL